MNGEIVANNDPLFDAETAAQYLGLGCLNHPAQAIRSMCRKRRLAHFRVCGRLMVRRSELDRYLAENAVEAIAQ